MELRRKHVVFLLVAFFAIGCTDITDPPPLVDEKPSFIVNGILDGNAHANAGGFLIDRDGDGQPNPFTEGACSGSLIAPTVFLTAAHCLGGPPPSVRKRWVGFDQGIFNPNLTFIPVTAIHRHPDFVPGSGLGNDMGVMLLEFAPSGIAPVSLPKRGLLGRMAKRDILGDQNFVVVGYGVTLIQGPGSFCIPLPAPFPACFYFDGRRRSATVSFVALDPVELLLDQNPDNGNGGACLGDSGAPVFLGDTDLVVGVTVRISGLSSGTCQGTSFNTRLDTKSARKFLKAFLDDDDDDDDDDDEKGGG